MWSYLSQDANTLGCAKSISLTGINECLVFSQTYISMWKSTHALSKIYIWDQKKQQGNLPPWQWQEKINTSCPKTYFWTKRRVFLLKSALKIMINCCTTWIFPKTWKTCNYIWGDVPSLVLQVLCDFIFWFLHLTILYVNMKKSFIDKWKNYWRGNLFETNQS